MGRVPTLETLFREGVAAYLECAPSIADHLIAFMHIPKTAGNSVVGAIEASMQNVYHVRWNDIAQSFDEMIEAYPRERYQMVTGHYRYPQIAKLQAAKIPYVAVAIIRDPIDRIISQYRYMRTPAHPEHEEFKQRFPTFEHFAQEGTDDNVLTRFLTGEVRTAEQAFARIQREYAFVGMTEFVNASTFLIQRMLGCEIMVPGHRNVTVSTPDNEVKISDRLHDVLHERHSVDIELHRLMYERFRTLVDDIFASAVEKKDGEASAAGGGAAETRKTRAAGETTAAKLRKEITFHPLDRFLQQFGLEVIDKRKAQVLNWENTIVKQGAAQLAELALEDLKDCASITDQWRSGIEHEIIYWWRSIAIDASGDNREAFAKRVTEGEAFQFEDLIAHQKSQRISALDIGCAVVPDLGTRSERFEIELSAIDPLGRVYDRMLRLFDLKPYYTLIPGMAEELSRVFEGRKFDFIHAKNSLDHCANPYQALLEIGNALADDGVAYLLHWDNEGEYHGYEEFHQWNITAAGEDEVRVWRPGDEKILPFAEMGIQTDLRLFDKKKRNGIDRRMNEIILRRKPR